MGSYRSEEKGAEGDELRVFCLKKNNIFLNAKGTMNV